MDKFTLTFTIEELRILDSALGNLPYKEVAPLINSINTQIQNNKKNINTDETS